MKKYFDISLVLSKSKRKEWKRILPTVLEEILNVNKKFFINWPEKHLYGKDVDWSVIPILYTHPTNEPTNSIWIDEVNYFMPTLYKFIKSLPNIRTALISKMGPNNRLEPHQGWKDVANHVLRAHFPLLVTSTSGICVVDEVRLHKDHDIILFDDSLLHSGFNGDTKRERYILIVDFIRPQNVQPGSSEIESTDALLKLIKMSSVIKMVYQQCITKE